MANPEKNAIRKRAHTVRAAAHAAQPDAGAAVAERFHDKLFDRYGPVVAGYWPIGVEIDPRPLMRKLEKMGARFVMPRVEANDTMTFRQARADGSDLVPGYADIPEPAADAPVLRPGLVLAPLLAFDASGTRLGHGEGHYDKALDALRADGPVFVCGLAFSEQEIAELPRESHDEPLDWVVTPERNLPLFLARAG